MDEDGARGALAWRTYAVVASLALAVAVADLGETANGVAFAVLGASVIAALVVGPLVHRPAERRTWQLLVLTSVAFTVGPVIRPHTAGSHGLAVALPDAFLLPGYVGAVLAFSRLLRLRRAEPDPHSVLDTAVVMVGAALVSVHLLVLPAAELRRALWLSVLTATYPLLDVLLLSLLVQLWFTSKVRIASLRWLTGAIGCLLVGDAGYAWLGRSGTLVAPSHWYDVPFAVGFACLGAAALHPSMPLLAHRQGRRVQPWSTGRLALLVPALMVPAVLLLVPVPQPGVRVLQAIGAVALTAAMLTRAGAAVREHSRSRRVFEHLATHDPLTGLPNRSLLHERLDPMLRGAHPVNLLFLDLDGFKLVNDSWGHAVGDELLVQVAERLRDHLPPDVLVARSGGDEFVLVTPQRRHDPDGQGFAEHVITELSQPFRLSVGDVVVTPSIGIACQASSDELTAEAMIRDADTAMYGAKAAGRSRAVVFDASMRRSVRERIALELALRQALDRDELEVVYQPVVELATGRLVSFEALLRWHRPGGDVRPDVFIPVAEENGLIIEIGRWVLDTALDQLVRWRATSPLEVGVAVNVSGRQLGHGGFDVDVLRALTRRGLPPRALRLEVTESSVVSDSPGTEATLRGLAEAGVSLSVDDFGTGYSSLSYLSRLSVNEIKVDRSFVSGLGERPEDEAIVRATAVMAQALGLAVVAEGIETEQQRDALVGLGIAQGQGWLLGRPMPAADALALVSRPLRSPASP